MARMRALHTCARGHGRSLAKLGRGFSRRFTLQFFKERAGERLGPAFWRRRKVAAHVRQGRAGDRSRRAFGQMRIVASAAILESARASNPLAKQISNHPWERHRTAVDRRSRT